MSKYHKTGYLDEQIINYLKVHDESAKTRDILKAIRVSRMTLYRSLKRLEAQGLLLVGHGSVELSKTLDIEPDFVSKAEVNRMIKEKIAKWTVENLVPKGAVLALESGTTVAACVPHLQKIKPSNLISNGIYVQQLAAELLPETDIFCCGGILRRHSMSYIGPDAARFFQNHHADVAIVGATGVDLELGIMDLEVDTKRQICDSSSRSILVVDSSKFGKRSMFSFGSLASVDTIVSDKQLAPEMAEQIRAIKGRNLILV